MVFDFLGVKAELSSKGQGPTTVVRDNFAVLRHHQQEKAEITHCSEIPLLHSENDEESPGKKADTRRCNEARSK